MRMQSVRWSENIAATSLIITALAGSALAGTYDDGKTAGTTTAQSALSQFGSRDSANRNISQPMTSPTDQMQTVDGSQHFQANLTAPA